MEKIDTDYKKTNNCNIVKVLLLCKGDIAEQVKLRMQYFKKSTLKF